MFKNTLIGCSRSLLCALSPPPAPLHLLPNCSTLSHWLVGVHYSVSVLIPCQPHALYLFSLYFSFVYGIFVVEDTFILIESK